MHFIDYGLIRCGVWRRPVWCKYGRQWHMPGWTRLCSPRTSTSCKSNSNTQHICRSNHRVNIDITVATNAVWRDVKNPGMTALISYRRITLWMWTVFYVRKFLLKSVFLKTLGPRAGTRNFCEFCSANTRSLGRRQFCGCEVRNAVQYLISAYMKSDAIKYFCYILVHFIQCMAIFN